MAKHRLVKGLKAIERQSNQPAARRLATRWPWPARACIVVAAAISANLLWHALTHEAMGGCGPGSPCDRVLGSPWAWWLNIPVSAPALVVYLVFLTSSFAAQSMGPNKFLGVGMAFGCACSVAILGGAVWFVGVQALSLHTFCKFCLGAHLFGVVGAGLFLLTARITALGSMVDFKYSAVGRQMAWGAGLGLLGVAVLVGGQLAYPRRMNLVRIHHGKFNFDRREFPVLGSPDASQAIVSLFDYTCPDCQAMHRQLTAARAKFAGQFCIITLPVPLHPDCNHLVKETKPKHAQACDYARLGLAVRRVGLEPFQKFDDWMFTQPSLPSLDEARKFARDLVGAAAMETSLKDPWVETTLQRGVEIYAANGKATGSLRMPQLVIGNVINVGPVRDVDLLDLLSANLGLK